MSTDRLLHFPQRPSPVEWTGDDVLIGPSPAIARVWSQLHRVAPHFRAAVITGEPGTGAEAAARTLHALSPTNDLPFLTVDAEQAEEMFTMTSALHPEIDGLVYFQEIERLSPAAQRGLLRRFRSRHRSPFRAVASPQHDLRASVSAGRFLPELADLLSTVRIVMPPLRERRPDLPFLATQFLRQVAERLGVAAPELALDFFEAAESFAWPGNLLQLQQIFESLLLDSGAAVYTAEHFAQACKTATLESSNPPLAPTRMIRLEEVVQEHIRAVLIACHGNKLRAAEVLGISRSTLYRMLDGAPSTNSYPLAG